MITNIAALLATYKGGNVVRKLSALCVVAFLSCASLASAASVASPTPAASETAYVQRYKQINAILSQIVQQAVKVAPESQNWAWKLRAISSDEPNAFSAAHGQIFITTALMDPTQFSDQEVAFVLAHEASHSLLHHLDRHEAADSHAAGLQRASALTWQDELAADRTAIFLLSNAGIDPRASVTILTKMEERSANLSWWTRRSHPTFTSRIEAMNALLPQAVAIYEQHFKLAEQPAPAVPTTVQKQQVAMLSLNNG